MELLRVQWRWGDPLDLYVMKPDGVKKPPVILYLYGFPDDTDRFEDEEFQKAATKGAFAAVGTCSAAAAFRVDFNPSMRERTMRRRRERLACDAYA